MPTPSHGDSLQHVQMLEAIGVVTVCVKTCDDFLQVDGLVIPGGESTVNAKILRDRPKVHLFIRKFALLTTLIVKPLL